ncbi:hypothetical protein KAH37_00205 [bacterium]|nr:hypothetical protein [bacterium]
MILKRFLANQMVKHKKKRAISLSILETKQSDSEVLDYNDSSYFAGLSRDGFSFVTRQSFRTNRSNENWLKVDIPGFGVWGFENRKMEEGEGFVQGNLKYQCQKPGEEWTISYDGPVFQNGEEREIKINLQWKSMTPIMDFDKEGTSPKQVASQLAKERWSLYFFRKLKEIHTVHYEQGGEITGTIQWREKEFSVKLKGVRDHSFGRRNWNDWERHIWFLGILDDGRFFNVSVIDYRFVKNLKAGFIFSNGKYTTFAQTPSFDELDLEEILPSELSLEVKSELNGEKIVIKTEMQQFFSFDMDGVYHIREAKSEFHYGSVKGIGIAEMGIKKDDITT